MNYFKNDSWEEKNWIYDLLLLNKAATELWKSFWQKDFFLLLRSEQVN